MKKGKSKGSGLIGRLCFAFGGILAYTTLVVVLIASMEPFNIAVLACTVRSTRWDAASPWAILQPLLVIGALTVTPWMANFSFNALFNKRRICRRVELKAAKRAWMLQQKKGESAKKCKEQKKSTVCTWLVHGTFNMISIAVFNATVYGVGLINDGSHRTACTIFRFTALTVVLVTLHLFGRRLQSVSTLYTRATVFVVGQLTRVVQRVSCGLLGYETKGMVSVVKKGVSCKKREGEKENSGPDGNAAKHSREEMERSSPDGNAATHSPEEMV